jgi:lysozyme
MMTLSDKGEKFLHQEEGFRLKAYRDSKGVPTIAFGNTFYEDGSPVKMGDTITKERAISLFQNIKGKFEDALNKAVKKPLTQNQFDALLSFIYNIGIAAFNRSTVLKRVNKDPNDPTIGEALRMWKNSGGKPVLLGRRNREWELYKSEE